MASCRCTLYLAHLERRAGEPALVKPRLDVPLVNLERDLHAYLAGDLAADFDVDAVDRQVAETEAPPTCALPGNECLHRLRCVVHTSLREITITSIHPRGCDYA